MMSHFLSTISAWWRTLTLSQEERWLAESANLAELENRMRRLQTATDRLIFTQHGG
jgi:hypothetical protein